MTGELPIALIIRVTSLEGTSQPFRTNEMTDLVRELAPKYGLIARIYPRLCSSIHSFRLLTVSSTARFVILVLDVARHRSPRFMYARLLHLSYTASSSPHNF